jgi:chaperonin cofactor prefoldin
MYNDYIKSIFSEDNITSLELNSSEYSDSVFSEVYLKKYYGGMNLSLSNDKQIEKVEENNIDIEINALEKQISDIDDEIIKLNSKIAKIKADEIDKKTQILKDPT